MSCSLYVCVTRPQVGESPVSCRTAGNHPRELWCMSCLTEEAKKLRMPRWCLYEPNFLRNFDDWIAARIFYANAQVDSVICRSILLAKDTQTDRKYVVIDRFGRPVYSEWVRSARPQGWTRHLENF